MNRNSLVVFSVFVLFRLLLVVSCAFGQETAYTLQSDWPSLEAKSSLGQVVGVAVGTDQQVFVFHRAGRTWTSTFPSEPIQQPTIAVLHATSGRLVSTFGAGMFIMPHGLSVDRDGNVWVTDVGSHQVFKIDAKTGEVLLTLGTAGMPGNDRSHFARPTDVAFAKDGSVFVSDGYVNTRVVRFSPSGKFLGQWGAAGSQPGQFDLPHGIAVSGKRVYVCDRSNLRVQVFDLQGRFVDQWRGSIVGRPFGVAVDRRRQVYVIDGGDQPDNTRSRVVVFNGRGQIQSVFTAATSNEMANLGHDIAVDDRGAVYVADAWANTIRKFTPARR